MAQKNSEKVIFVIGGVMSGVGKGVTSASLGAILTARGFIVTALKADPYINVDAGTMNPTEHGEVFVTDDGDETDQDMGNYERFLEADLLSCNYMTTGRVYLSVIEAERAMKYKGKCVEVVPHIPEEIIRRIKHARQQAKADITIVEIGGTLGEYQNLLFLEAARMMKLEKPNDVVFVLVSYLPIPSHIGEMKTKPTQQAARQLNSAGIQADFIVARGTHELDTPRKEKLARFCGVPKDHCISAPDVATIYEIPLKMEEQGVSNKLLKTLSLRAKKNDMHMWETFVQGIKKCEKEVKIAVVGKYFEIGDYTLSDSYISVIESVKHACWYHGVKPVMDWIDSEDFESKKQSAKKVLSGYDGIIVPGGFGTRGVEGIIQAIQVAREEKIPYFGLCYGMQLATIEFARHVLKLKGAHTVEVDAQTPHPIIHINPVQLKNVVAKRYGGTMRLGAYDCVLRKGSLSLEAYGNSCISERHRHRYEFNNAYRDQVDAAGLLMTGINPETDLVEIIELKDHPFFVGVQFHPEFKSRPRRAHPLFRSFIAHALQGKRGK